jgi:hypothetical protein
LTLTDTGDASAVISGISITGAAFSEGGGSNVALAPGQSVSISVGFGPTASGSEQGELSVASNASNSPVQIALSGTGLQPPAVQHSVALNWQASTSNVIGYFVYRGDSPADLSRLSDNVTAATNYTDNNVADGQTYVYAVTAVNSGLIESLQSSPVTVSIPTN